MLFRSVPHPRRLKGQVLDLVGIGNIGRQVAAKAAGFGLKVVAHDPFVQADHVDVTGVGAVPLLGLDEMLAVADIVSLHCPLSPATRHLIGAPQLAKMRPGAILINTARGGLIDQDALVDALRSGHLGAAGLDVTTPEPLPHPHALRELSNVLLTPHTASISVESGIDCRNATVDHAVALLEGRVPPDVMNRAVLTPGRWRGADSEAVPAKECLMANKLRHIAISVPDIKAAAEFYKKTFGLEQVGYVRPSIRSYLSR